MDTVESGYMRTQHMSTNTLVSYPDPTHSGGIWARDYQYFGYGGVREAVYVSNVIFKRSYMRQKAFP